MKIKWRQSPWNFSIPMVQVANRQTNKQKQVERKQSTMISNEWNEQRKWVKIDNCKWKTKMAKKKFHLLRCFFFHCNHAQQTAQDPDIFFFFFWKKLFIIHLASNFFSLEISMSAVDYHISSEYTNRDNDYNFFLFLSLFWAQLYIRDDHYHHGKSSVNVLIKFWQSAKKNFFFWWQPNEEETIQLNLM